MSAKSFESLSYSEQKLYNEIVRRIEAYQTEWTFPQVTVEAAGKAFHAVLDDHPEYFWFGSTCVSTERTRGSQVSVTLEPEYIASVSDIPAMRRQFNALVDTVIRRAKQHSPLLYEQILFLHDYIVLQTDYQLERPHCFDAYGCLILHRAVCAGYAAAFQVLMEKLGVECGCVSGRSSTSRTGEVSHSWNYIKLSDGYYYVDVTWDDPVLDDRTVTDNLSHDFFCLDYQDTLLTHSFAAQPFIPKNCGTRFNYFRYRGWYLERYSFPAFREIAVKQLQRSDEISVKFGSKQALEEARRDLIDNDRVFSIPGFSHRVSYGFSKSGLILNIIRR